MTWKAKVDYFKKQILRKLSSGIDRLLFHLNIPVTFTLPDEESVIVYTCDNTRLEIAKYAHYLKQNHQLKILLIIPKTRVSKFLYTNDFQNIIQYRNSFHLLRIIKKIKKNVQLIHYFGRTSRSGFLLKKHFSIPFVFSAKDLSVVYEGIDTKNATFRADMKYEKYCLQNADGLISESLEIQPAARLYNIKKPPALFFPVYMDNRNFWKHKQPFTENKKIQWVYAGGVHPKNASDALGAMKLHWLIDACEKNQIYFHIYPNHGLHPSIYEEYFKIALNSQYFQIHQPVSPENLIDEIKQYDFGIIPFFNEDTSRIPLKRQYCTSNKLFNYIEAGLPVLISEDMHFQLFIANRIGAAVKMKKKDFIDFRKKMSDINYNQIYHTLTKRREQYSLNTQIHRMNQFYQKLIK